MADAEIVVEKIPLRVGDIVRMIVDPPSYGYNANSVSTTITTSNNVQNQPWWTYVQTPFIGNQPTWVSSPTITLNYKLPPAGAALIIAGVLKNETYPLDVQDLETGEEYEVYRYQIKRDDFMTAVHRRREARTVAITPAIECAPRIEEQRLLEAAI